MSRKYLDHARHSDAVGGERELEVEGGVVSLLAVVAAPELLAEDDVVVVEEDVAALALVAVEEHLAGRRQHGALVPASVLCRGDLRTGIELD